MWRRPAAALVVAMACAALYELVWIPLRCNVVKGEAKRENERAARQRDPYVGRMIASRNVERIEPWLERQPRDVELMMQAGMSLERMRRFGAAARLYCGALAHDRRPELYVACGRMQLLTGERDAAIANFVIAGEFAGMRYVTNIPDPLLRADIARIVGTRHEQNLARRGRLDTRNVVLNADFSKLSSRSSGSETRRTTAPSAAHAWALVNPQKTAISSAVQESPRGSGKALHVVTTSRDSGIRQIWPVANRRPRVRAAALVFVRRGKICFGVSDGRSFLTNACSKKTGVWEKLEAVNESCPATVVAILASSDDGAEFLVDDVTARVTFAAGPCEP